jgi:RNA polymerase sigma-70 factor (ECF subfamily)
MPQTTTTEAPDAPALFETYYDRIYRYVLSLTGDLAEADDLTQETFLRAYRGRDSLHDAGALTTWLYRIATHVCLDRLRQRVRRAPLESEADPDDVDLADPDIPSLQQTVERNEMGACVQQYLEDLPDSYRAAILLHDLHGLTGPEIAETLGVSLATVKIRLHRARRKLQAALEDGCAFSHDERDVLVCEPKP